MFQSLPDGVIYPASTGEVQKSAHCFQLFHTRGRARFGKQLECGYGTLQRRAGDGDDPYEPDPGVGSE